MPKAYLSRYNEQGARYSSSLDRSGIRTITASFFFLRCFFNICLSFGKLSTNATFANSSAFTFVGHSVNKSPISGDKIIIKSSMSFDDGFGNITYSLHSANVISSSGSTRSKLGSCGVYNVPINELVRFYDGFFYNIYR